MNEPKHILVNIFSYQYLIQYGLAILYYRTKHFKNTLLIFKPYKVYLKYVYTSGVIISIILSIITVIVFMKVRDEEVYSIITYEVNVKVKIIVIIMIFLNRLYSYNVFFTNMIFFATTFIVQSINIKKYSEKLGELINKNLNNLTIQSFIKDFTEIKELHTNSVENMNNIFSCMTMLGIVACFYIYTHLLSGYVSIISYFDVVCFVVSEGIYIYAITRIKDSVSNISDVINTSKFIDIFLTRNYLEDIYGDIYDNYATETYSKLVLSKRRSVSDMKDIKKDNSERNLKKDNKKIDYIKDLSMRNVIMLKETSNSVDWIILNEKLNAPWSSFKILGFEINDADLFKKIIVIIGGFIMIMDINNMCLF